MEVEQLELVCFESCEGCFEALTYSLIHIAVLSAPSYKVNSYDGQNLWCVLDRYHWVQFCLNYQPSLLPTELDYFTISFKNVNTLSCLTTHLAKISF